MNDLALGAGESMLGKWDNWYRNVTHMSSFKYGDTVTYRLAEDFLSGLDVEDWGCGTGGFKRLHRGGYIGIDGSVTPFVDKVWDLRNYRSNTDGIMMRHVLEHNYDWEKVLENAIASFKKRFCLVMFTPFSDRTRVIAQNKQYGVDVPDIVFNRNDIERHLKDFKWKLTDNIRNRTGYGVERIYFVEKGTG